MNIIGKLGALQQLMKGSKMKPATAMSDDGILVRKIVAEHNPDGTKYDVKPIFHVVEDALRRSTTSSTEDLAPVDHVKDRSHHTGYTGMPEALSAKIDQISSEISYKTLDRVVARSSTEAIFEMLTTYNWDVKIVLALAAFSLTYGEFWLGVHIHDTYQRAKSKEILKQLPSIVENVNLLKLKPPYDTLKDLVNLILEVTKCVMEFHDLPTEYIPQDIQAYATAYNYVPVACYWTLRSIVACAAQITSFSTSGHEISTSTDAWELSTLISKLKNILDRLREILNSCHEHIGERMDGVYQLLPFIFSKPNTHNEKILKHYIQPLYDGVTKKRVSLEPLRWKNVLLQFSGPEISTKELLIVEQIYNETKAHEPTIEGSIHELVWIPIVDPNSKSIEPMQKQFESVRESMPWYSVYHPSLIGKQVISFIQREWKYKNKPILVGLDPIGRVSSTNAIHMMWIWGSAAYPFTNSRAEALWKEETWRLELLVDGVDISNWIKDEKYIFLYGGGDLEWVTRFVKEAHRVAEATKISLEMVYVGKSIDRKQVQNIIDTIKREELNTLFLPEQSMIWMFWTRLQSMFFSKLRLNQTDDDDHVMKEIKKLLSYDKQSGWIVLARGSHIVVTGHATTGLQTLVEYDNEWKEYADRDGFEAGFKNHYNKLHSVVSPCCRFEVSAEVGDIPESLTCPECRRNMQVFTTIRCCHDGKFYEDFFASTVTPTI